MGDFGRRRETRNEALYAAGTNAETRDSNYENERQPLDDKLAPVQCPYIAYAILTGNAETSAIKTRTGVRSREPEISRSFVLILNVECQAAAVGVFLPFF